jgi:hypothetical protein
MTYSITSLDILGHRGEPVPNTLYTREGAAEEIGVLLPGIGYTAQMPLLWYARRVLQERNADVLAVDYAYMTRPEFRHFGPGAEERLHSDVAAAVHSALRYRHYARVTLIGKSLGTLAMGCLLADRIVEPSCAIWLTPLLKREELFTQMLRQQHRSLIVIGTADAHYDPGLLSQLRTATGGEELVIDDADHAMEIEDDTLRSVRAMERIVEAMQHVLAG